MNGILASKRLRRELFPVAMSSVSPERGCPLIRTSDEVNLSGTHGRTTELLSTSSAPAACGLLAARSTEFVQEEEK
jgi:hypothetical protein